jgi:hypothetical protein
VKEMLSKRPERNSIFCKQTLLILGTLLLVLAFTVNVQAALKDSPHDVTTGQCNLCHLQITKEGKKPSWNTMQMLVMDVSFSSQSHDMGDGNHPQGVSILCLSCHDPMTANSAGSSGASFHPSSFTYAPLRDIDQNGFSRPKAICETPERKVIVGNKSKTMYPLYGKNYDQIECPTCHNPHYAENELIVGTYHNSLLRHGSSRFSLCGDCHTAKY